MLNNYFLQVNKDLFGLGFNPTQLLIIAQVMEFERTTGDCYITDAQLAENFGVSTSTISREISKLVEMNVLRKETRNTQSGKERKLFYNPATVNLLIAQKAKRADASSATVNLPIAQKAKRADASSATVNLPIAQKANCLLRTEQNDLIKDNIEKEKEKDNMRGESEALSPRAESKLSSQQQPREEEYPISGTLSQYEAKCLCGGAAWVNKNIIRASNGKYFNVV